MLQVREMTKSLTLVCRTWIYILAVVLTASCAVFSLPEAERVTIEYDPASRDIGSFYHAASFRLLLDSALDVYWVPASTLGPSGLSNARVEALQYQTPEQIQTAITTLYELIQYFQVHAFVWVDSNYLSREGGITWEHHMPGYDTVLNTRGNCASFSSLAVYLLQGDYPEVGFIGQNARESGHIFNYIYHNSRYYIFDLTALQNSYYPGIPQETGTFSEYMRGPFSVIHEAGSLADFIQYLKNLSAQMGITEQAFYYQLSGCTDTPPIGYNFSDFGRRQHLYFLDTLRSRYTVLYHNPLHNLSYEFRSGPTKRLPDFWSD